MSFFNPENFHNQCGASPVDTALFELSQISETTSNNNVAPAVASYHHGDDDDDDDDGDDDPFGTVNSQEIRAKVDKILENAATTQHLVDEERVVDSVFRSLVACIIRDDIEHFTRLLFPVQHAASTTNGAALLVNFQHPHNGLSLLHVAAEFGRVEIVRLLVESGASVHLATMEGAMPLHNAASSAKTKVISLLYEMNADFNATDDEGDSPLHYAIRDSRVDSVRALLQYGADPSQANDDGESPLEFAQELGEHDIAKLLKSAMGDEKPRKHAPSASNVCWAKKDGAPLPNFYTMVVKRSNASSSANHHSYNNYVATQIVR
mmetsp:Transcript_6220/g.9703  ORF Transcript_6220/g.9703 Transcript_6220/m.9703 type:complete len:321 (+) Transcript_6220:100-1062(+)|eukprot:CAMPEP_0201544858 /NCGR_PEP_ID=MMETSP0173_2-20130828/1476_1 /ASSEMBLY_ACC=CAM_ASM_000268 /TAXON_ID=218659 /ORGANISM="Vexillifera sp., Strain DIVA3 564/2" /LENGTH=320 /DNA_ID=CAMNT_0047953131 /DNA_START=88 /DNA_END=1050 /DNA_ORIENTATION=-